MAVRSFTCFNGSDTAFGKLDSYSNSLDFTSPKLGAAVSFLFLD